MRRKQRETSKSGRRVPGRPTAKKVFIVCEKDNKTERIYLRNFEQRDSNVQVIVEKDHKYIVPEELVAYAIRQRDKHGLSTENGDTIWCVLDVDLNQNQDPRTKDQQFKQAQAKAESEGIQLALSNPSFEIWFLLHYESCGGALTNEELIQKLRKHLPHYSKTKCVYREITADGKQETAITHADRLLKQHERAERDPFTCASNPSTQIHTLIRHIERVKQQNKTS